MESMPCKALDTHQPLISFQSSKKIWLETHSAQPNETLSTTATNNIVCVCQTLVRAMYTTWSPWFMLIKMKLSDRLRLWLVLLSLLCRELVQHFYNALGSDRADEKKNSDVHTRLMEAYAPVPQQWFLILLIGCLILAIVGAEGYKEQLQLPWWGVLMGCIIAIMFTLPFGVLVATANQACSHLHIASFLLLICAWYLCESAKLLLTLCHCWHYHSH